MHPNGQLPAYEFAFGDVNPPVHAWAVLARLQDRPARTGDRDLLFLERAFQKLLLNFTWWVNRKDVDGNNLFGGGFLGLDNIGVFDRSQAAARRRPPRAGRRHRVDGVLLPDHAGHGARAGARQTRPTRTSPPSSSSTSSHIADAMNYARRHRALGRARTASTTTSSSSTAAGPCRCASARSSACIPLFAVDGARATKSIDAAARLPQAHGLVPRQPPGPRAPHRVPGAPSGENAGRCLLAIPSRERLARVPRATCSTRTSSSRPTASARSARRTSDTRSSFEHWRPASTASSYMPGESRHRHVRRQLQLARAGLVPAQLPAHRGARALPPLLRRLASRSSAPPARADMMTLGEVAGGAVATG